MKATWLSLLWRLFVGFLWLVVLLVLTLAFSSIGKAEEIHPEKEWVWGCQIKGRSLEGGCVLYRFTKVGEVENDVDTDEPRVIGFEPGNVYVDSQGRPVWMRIPAKSFLQPGEVKLVSGAKCVCARTR